jgi:hypothetical protein
MLGETRLLSNGGQLCVMASKGSAVVVASARENEAWYEFELNSDEARDLAELLTEASELIVEARGA